MSQDDFSRYMATAVGHFAQEKMKGEGLNLEQATQVAEESFSRLLPEGLKTENQFLFSVVEDATGHAIGILWFARRQQGEKKSAFIYDISLEPEFRGRGFGKELMRLVEVEARRLGLASIGLHVFGHNTTAIRLYEKSGFRTTNRVMAKDLD